MLSVMSASTFGGIYPALLTPLDSTHQLRPEMARQLMLHLLSTGAHGVYIAGSTGEGMRLTLETRKALVEALAPALPEDRHLIVHVGAPDVQDAIRLANHAAEHGAHAISSLPPVADADGVRAYYETLAKNSVLPLILYYFPKVSPDAFADPQSLIDICDLPNVLGVKFTDFNLYLMQRLVRRGKLVFNGYDEVLAAGLLMGAQGGIGSTYNAMPEIYLKIYRAAERGDWEDARRWQSRANEVLAVLLRYPFFPALRTMVERRGFDCGPMMSGEGFRSQAEKQQLIAELNKTLTDEVAELIGWHSAPAVR